jgi:hypothetical protein
MRETKLVVTRGWSSMRFCACLFTVLGLLASNLISNPAFADGLLSYPVQVDFKSADICKSVEYSIDVEKPKEASVLDGKPALAVKCQGSTLTGTVAAGPKLSSVPVRIPQLSKGLCEQVLASIQTAKPVTQQSCESPQPQVPSSVPFHNAIQTYLSSYNAFETYFPHGWTATFNLPLSDGKSFDEIQQREIADIQKQKAKRDLNDDIAFCQNPTNASSPNCQQILHDNNPAVFNVQNSTKEGTPVGGGASSNSGNSGKSGATTTKTGP